VLKVWLDYNFRGSTTRKITDYEETIAKKPDLVIIMKGIFWMIKNLNYLRKKTQNG